MFCKEHCSTFSHRLSFFILSPWSLFDSAEWLVFSCPWCSTVCLVYSPRVLDLCWNPLCIVRTFLSLVWETSFSSVCVAFLSIHRWIMVNHKFVGLVLQSRATVLSTSSWYLAPLVMVPVPFCASLQYWPMHLFILATMMHDQSTAWDCIFLGFFHDQARSGLCEPLCGSLLLPAGSCASRCLWRTVKFYGQYVWIMDDLRPWCSPTLYPWASVLDVHHCDGSLLLF